jgi:5'(3')-deoxyribonucleotidase
MPSQDENEKNHMKPTLLLDCDGVLSNFAQAALNILEEVSGLSFSEKDIHTWEVFDSLPPHAQQWRSTVYRILKERGGCAGIPLHEGAKEGVARLQALADIIVVTSPFKGSETWAHEREHWLESHFGLTHVIHAKNKARIHGDFFLDDKPEHIKEWLDFWVRSGRDLKCKAVLWRTPRITGEAISPLAFYTDDWDYVVDLVVHHR